MKTPHPKRPAKLQLTLKSYGSYIDEACQLEKLLARKPAKLSIELIGSGEIPPDSALLIRSILLARSARTRLVTNARSSLRGAAVLVWLLGDTRLIREDASLYFRAAGPFADGEDGQPVWRERDWFDDDDDQEKADYVRVLQLINEFLPVKELAGRPIGLPALRQFGLVENEKVDRFLAAAFAKQAEPPNDSLSKPEQKSVQQNAGTQESKPVQGQSPVPRNE